MNVVQLNRPAKHGNPKRRPQSAKGIVAALDVGSTKICCLIADIGEKDGKPDIRVLGVGHHAAGGVRAGAIVNIDEAERSIRLAVDAAERMAQKTVGEVFVNVSGGRPVCHTYGGSCQIAGEAVDRHDVNSVVGVAMRQAKLPGRVLLHASPVQYELDGAKGVSAPEGMFANKLGVDVNAVLVEPGAMRNLALAIERCHLSVSGFVISPYAAGHSVLEDDERELGVTLVDMGGATTSVAVFHDGKLVYGDVVPVGGHHITKDLARGLTTTIAHAERMKTLYGSALASIYDDRELIAVPLLGERGVDSVNKVPRSMLTGIIRPRLEEIFELVRERLEASPVANKLGRRMVLSGGASQLTGMREAAGQILSRNIRLAEPRGVKGLPDSAKSPAFSVATGLLFYSLNPDQHTSRLLQFAENEGRSERYFNRVGRWIKESF